MHHDTPHGNEHSHGTAHPTVRHTGYTGWRRFHHFTELKKNSGNQTSIPQSTSHNTTTVQVILKSIRDLQSHRSLNIQNIATVKFK